VVIRAPAGGAWRVTRVVEAAITDAITERIRGVSGTRPALLLFN